MSLGSRGPSTRLSKRKRSASAREHARDHFVTSSLILRTKFSPTLGWTFLKKYSSLSLTILDDEMACYRGTYKHLRFRNGDTAAKVKFAIQPSRCIDYVQEKVFAIDFDEKSVRVARFLNLIAGDGETNVLHLNSLDWTKWDETVKHDEWQELYSDGWRKLRKLSPGRNQKDYRHFAFDVLMASSPHSRSNPSTIAARRSTSRMRMGVLFATPTGISLWLMISSIMMG